nr:hypothetical protein S36_0540 [uncultured bacterium]AUF80948.1 hypothetical protein S37_0561 [uncultured bacterium]
MRTLATATLPLPIVLALLFAPLQTLSGTAYACSCIETTVEERVQSADVVAIGTVVSLYEDETTEDGIFVDIDGVVRVSAYYKGSGPSEIAVDDPAHEGVCGIIGDDSVGREAVLFLELSDGEYLTHLCAGSQIIHGDEDVLAGTIAAIEAVTGPGQPPDGSPPHDEPTEHTESTPWAVILPLAFAIPLAVLVVPAFLRRRGGH